MEKSVVRLIPHTVVPIWSGTRLSKYYKRFSGCGTIGEAWETSVEDDAVAFVENEGTMIPFTEHLMKNKIPSFPLIKLIDAMSPLSVQVHPDDDAAKKHGGISKNEIWYVLQADEGAFIYYGTKDGVTAEDVKVALSGEKNLLELLNKVPVSCGDVFMIPPGMIHSLGGGITVLEVQNKAGTTYRLKDIAGNREIHITQSLDSAKLYSADEAAGFAHTMTVSDFNAHISGDIIADTEDYRIIRYVSGGASVTVTIDPEVSYLFCESGGGRVGDVTFTTGDALFITGKGSDVSLFPDSSVILVS